MKKISRRTFLQASGVLAAASLAGCGTAGSSSSASHAAGSAGSSSATAADSTLHEPITILTASRDYTAFLELLHAKYPEINVQFEPYRGQNTSAYLKRQLASGCMPDIYTSTSVWEDALQAEHLIDLSKYGITDLYAPAQMAQTDVDGATYLVPYDYTILALGCNRSLFERNGWQLPQSFADVEALLPEFQAAGVTPATCLINLPGFGFQYFCNVADTVFLNTLEGRRWQQDFLAGSATAAEGLADSAAYFQRWIDAGMINLKHADENNGAVLHAFREGNSAFFVGALSNYTQNDDGSGDQYSALPYLSPDGTTNTYVQQVIRFYGLNKQLEEPGSEQKLEDALHFLEVLSSPEGFATITTNITVSLCALRDFTLPEENPYYNALSEINSGHLAPLLYSGWEEHASHFGAAVHSWAAGEMTGAEALAVMDQTQQELLAAGTPTYANVTETLDTRATARFIGQTYISKAGVDAALISYNVWKAGVTATQENAYGVSGKLLPGAMTEMDIVSILPTGWYNNIPTVRLTGARIHEIEAAGFDQNQNGDPYPYVLVTRPGLALEDTLTYTVAYAGLDAAIAEANTPQDSGVLGLDAAKAYFKQVGSISPRSLW